MHDKAYYNGKKVKILEVENSRKNIIARDVKIYTEGELWVDIRELDFKFNVTEQRIKIYDFHAKI